MKKPSLIVVTMLAVVLLSGTFISLAAAQDQRVPDASAVPDPTQTDSNDNSTSTQSSDVLYTAQENRTTADDNQVLSNVPDAENPNLIATQTSTDNTLTILAVVGALAIAVVAASILFYRKKSKADS